MLSRAYEVLTVVSFITGAALFDAKPAFATAVILGGVTFFFLAKSEGGFHENYIDVDNSDVIDLLRANERKSRRTRKH